MEHLIFFPRKSPGFAFPSSQWTEYNPTFIELLLDGGTAGDHRETHIEETWLLATRVLELTILHSTFSAQCDTFKEQSELLLTSAQPLLRKELNGQCCGTTG